MELTTDQLEKCKALYHKGGSKAVGSYLSVTPEYAKHMMSEYDIRYWRTLKAKETRDKLKKAFSLRGTFSELARYLDTEISKLRTMCLNLGLEDDRVKGLIDPWGQYCLWVVEYWIHVHGMRVVHVADNAPEPQTGQLSLFNSSNTGIINAADRFIAEASGNDIVQLYAAAQ